jgi:hypothetical protein
MVEYINIQDKKYPIIVNFYVLGDFQKETGYSFDSLVNLQNNLYLVEPLFWHSLKVGHIIAKEPFTIKREDMPLLLSDNKVYEEFFKIIQRFFPEQKEVKSDKKK